MLYLETHDLHLMTFPEGKFEHQIITKEEAKLLIDKSITENDFFGSYRHDNSNPKRADKKFNEFVDLLKEHCDIDLPLEKFFDKDIDENGKEIFFGHPAGLFTLTEGDQLLLVDYAFSLELKTDKPFNLDDGFSISPDTLKFHLFQLLV